ncbi:hypothetical protein FNV43_RR19118 [Rhamnella rubrinervis]|uniref:Uncharacterized protein n=1 Tax=Rhamnella rubrinervis TaxID=2594499 RepID=A0A8K0GTJ6_9ROSA|nr:hypothetical protein FNV43_RR19118 [Rhamnella rubrinervis]
MPLPLSFSRAHCLESPSLSSRAQSSAIMDPKYTGDMFKHLEKQNELLEEAKRSMSEELRKLQVEEEMLMRKFYEIMTAHGLIKREEDRGNISDDDARDGGHSTALVCTISNEEQ